MNSKRLTIATALLALGLVCVASAATVDPLLRELQSRQDKADSPSWALGTYWNDLVALEVDTKNGDLRIGVILYLDGNLPDLEDIEGLKIGSVCGDIATARLPLWAVPELAAVPGIRHVAASRIRHLTNDIGLPATNVDDVWNGAPAYTGDGVLLAVIDTGIDWQHDDFKNPDGTTRIKYIWDQFGTGGTPPSGFTYGVEYDAAAINAGSVSQYDLSGHGTHVVGTAAGDGSASGGQYSGVAYQSDILFSKAYNDNGGGFPDDKTIDAMNYLVQKAASLGQPVAINMSLGGHWGPHDGTYPQSQVINNLSGPGVVFCVAAGNEGGDYVAEKGPAANHDFLLRVPDYTPNGGANTDSWLVQIWYDGATSPSFSISYGGWTSDVIPSGSSNGWDTNWGYAVIDNASSGPDPANNDKVCWVVMDDRAGTEVMASDYTINITGGSGDAVGYVIGSSMYCGFLNSDQTYSVGMPSCAESAISVAAYTTRVTWPIVGGTGGYSAAPTIDERAPFSSFGPTRTGGQKPDVSAPGMAIVSCLSRTRNPAAPAELVLPGGEYYAIQGTSMASPLTCGVVGLMFEKDPTLTATQVRNFLRDTAAHDSYTGSGWSNGYGAGKVDAFAAMAAISGGVGDADGDVDGNSTVNILDVILLVNYILDPGGYPLNTEQRTAADVYPAGGGDGTLNISDVIRIVAFILGTDTPGAPVPTARPVTVSMGDPYRDRGTWWVPLEFTGEVMAGGQFAVTIDGADWRADGVRLVDADGCAVAANAVGDQLRVMLYSETNQVPSGATVLLPYDTATPAANSPRLSGLIVADSYGYARETTVVGGISALPSVGFVQVFPNPTRTDTRVQFQLNRGLDVTLDVFDLRGRRVRQLTTGSLDAGLHSIGWDGRDEDQHLVAAGLYLVRLRTPEQVVTSKVVFSR